MFIFELLIKFNFCVCLLTTHLKKSFNVETVPYFSEIKKEEFKKVMKFLRANNRQGSAQRDGLHIGLKVDNSVDNGGLVEYFFGKDRKDHLQLMNFAQFVNDLHKEVCVYGWP